jgi:hypothetical protein
MYSNPAIFVGGSTTLAGQDAVLANILLQFQELLRVEQMAGVVVTRNNFLDCEMP